MLLDERQESINDGLFLIDMDGYPKSSPLGLADFPAIYHNGASGIAFADGHAEIKKWRDAKILKATSVNQPKDPNSTDLPWLQERSTSKL